MFLSIIIPAYNEKENINRGVLKEVFNYLKKQKYKWEVILIDDGSTDKTLQQLASFIKVHTGFKLLQEPHRGKGGAIIAGIGQAQGNTILLTDFDQSTSLSEVKKFFPKFEQGYDGAIGVRLTRTNSPLARKITGYGFIFLQQLILGLPYKDTQCGFKMFRKNAIEKIITIIKKDFEKEKKGYASTAGFDLELLYVGHKLGLEIAEVPVVWRSHLAKKDFNLSRVSYLALKDLLTLAFYNFTRRAGV